MKKLIHMFKVIFEAVLTFVGVSLTCILAIIILPLVIAIAIGLMVMFPVLLPAVLVVSMIVAIPACFITESVLYGTRYITTMREIHKLKQKIKEKEEENGRDPEQ